MPENPKKKSPVLTLFFQWLPMIYIVIGVATMIAFRNLLSLVVGVVLIAVAGVEHLRRENARRIKDAQNSRMTTRMGGDREGPATQMLMQLTWRESYECGHPVIDQQHKRLFHIGDKLINAVLKHKDREVVEDLLDELNEHIRHHFETEEAVMARTRFPLSDEHKDQHQALLDRAHELRQRYRNNEIEVGDLVGFIAYDVVTQHIVHEDRKFALKPA